MNKLREALRNHPWTVSWIKGFGIPSRSLINPISWCWYKSFRNALCLFYSLLKGKGWCVWRRNVSTSLSLRILKVDMFFRVCQPGIPCDRGQRLTLISASAAEWLSFICSLKAVTACGFIRACCSWLHDGMSPSLFWSQAVIPLVLLGGSSWGMHFASRTV